MKNMTFLKILCFFESILGSKKGKFLIVNSVFLVFFGFSEIEFSLQFGFFEMLNSTERRDFWEFCPKMEIRSTAKMKLLHTYYEGNEAPDKKSPPHPRGLCSSGMRSRRVRLLRISLFGTSKREMRRRGTPLLRISLFGT